MSKSNFTVVRNESYATSQVTMCEGHNERRNKNPLNADIVSERQELNIHYRQNFADDGTAESYQQTIDRLLAERKIVKHNFKPKSAIMDELIFDVNTEYFEQNGGYDFAKKYFEEVYRYAISEIGLEDYILSAVMHADERNKEASERLDHDVFHYHLHIVYIPVVQKELKWTKRAGAELAGKVKEVIPQINHTDKWPRKKVGKGFINEYSKLQTRYFEHMKSAGFPDIERGAVGSTAKHLEVLDYKIQQDEKRLEALNQKIEKRESKVEKLDEKIEVKTKAKATIAEIDGMGKHALFGNYTVSADELTKLKTLAKKSVTIENRNAEWKKKIAAVEQQLVDVKMELNEVAKSRDYWKKKFKDLEQMVKPYLTAILNFPEVLKNFIEQHWKERRLEQQISKSKSRGMGL